MKRIILALCLLTPSFASADGYVLGAGRWTCSEVVEVFESGSDLKKGQLVGWLLGYWSGATFNAPTSFVDIVENAGGQKIFELSVAECRKAPPETLLFRVTQSIISNTG